MKQFLVFPFILVIFVSTSHAGFYKALRCQSNISVELKGNKNKSQFHKGAFEVSREMSQVMVLKGKEGQVLGKVFPWYGVDFQIPKSSTVLAKKSTDTTFSLSVKTKKSNEVASLSCTRM